MKKVKKKIIPIERLTADRVLAEDITRPNGDLIFRRGGKLSEYIIDRLKRFGIKNVAIFDEGENGNTHDPEYIKKKLKEIEQGLDHRFRKVNHVPLMRNVKDIISEHMKAKLF